MEKDRLYRLLPKDKGPIQPAKAKCVGFISENGNFDCRPVPQEKLVNSAMYLCVRQSYGAEKLLEHEKQRGMRYCRLQGYEPLVLLESIGDDVFMEEKALGKLLKLAEQGLINVVVCKLRPKGTPVPPKRNGYSVFNGTKYRYSLIF